MEIIARSVGAIRRACTLMVLLVTLWLSGAAAQEVGVDTDPQPLQPADTSSPRATLQTFLTNANTFIDAWRSGELTPASIRAQARAADTLDFSATADGNSTTVRNQRFFMLKELLDRVDLPAFGQIPGASEVADEDIAAWSIPDTKITIRQQTFGPQAGAFLFAADTIAQLDRLYVMARHLPYQPGATAGIYEAFLQSEEMGDGLQSRIRSRLKPVDTSSPQSTLLGFLTNMNRAYEISVQANDALAADPPTMTPEEARALEAAADDYLSRAVATLDLSRTSEALREDHGIETALLLKEIFDRLHLPQPSAIPDRRMVTHGRQGATAAFMQGVAPLTWYYPDTSIAIVEISEGDRQGEFLFSADTVAEADTIYATIADLPYRQQDLDALALGFENLQKSEGFYEHYISTPGYLIAAASPLGRFVGSLPPQFSEVYGGQAVWQWIALVVAIPLVAAAAVAIFWLFHRSALRRRPPLDSWLKPLAPLGVALIVTAVTYLIDEVINITGTTIEVIKTIGSAIVIAMTAWAIVSLCKAIAETFIHSPKIRDQGIDASMLRITAAVIGFSVAAWLVIDGARDLGADMVPVLAGLGVGGLAVALAAQKTIANFIGSMILFANRPVRVGDFCRYGDQIGTVESIGLHSTRIRSLERTIVTVPNAEFSDMKLDNFTARDQRLLKTTLRLRYDTTEDQLRFVLARLRALVLGHPMVTHDPARVRFVDYGISSKDIEIFAYLRCRDQDSFLAIKEDILLRIGEIIKTAGTGFALPSQTAYLGRDSGLDTERLEQAETEIHRLRMTGKLPFPEFEAEERDRLEDSLDYPQKGSPDHIPRR